MADKRNLFSNRAVDPWNMFLRVIKRSETVKISKNVYRNTERTWWETSKKGAEMHGDQPVAGPHPVSDMYFSRDPTWVAGCKSTIYNLHF